MIILKNIVFSISLISADKEPKKAPPPMPPEVKEIIIDAQMRSHLDDFLTYSLDLDPETVTLVEKIPQNSAEGGGKNKLFHIKRDDTSIGYIKLVPSEDFGEYEKRSLEKYASLGLSHHAPTTLLGYGEFLFGNTKYTALSMTAAKGKNLYTFIEDVGKAPKNSLSRKKALNQLLTATKITAVAYKELHEAHPTDTVAREYFQRNDMLLNIYLEENDADPTQTDALAQIFQKSSPLSGYIHGDAHPGNIFVDLTKNKVTLIDLPDMYPSIKNPTRGGPIVEDYASFIYFAKILGKQGGLTPTEIIAFEKAFKKAYGNPTSFDRQSLAYYEKLLALN